MSRHAQLKFVMTESSKTQIRLTGLNFPLSSYIFDLKYMVKLLTVRTHKKKKKKISMPVQTIRNYAFGKLHSLFELIEIKTYRERKITCFVSIYIFGTKEDF